MAASTFLFHPLMNEVVPYNASYEFPSQATRSTKRTIKMTPKNNVSSFISGSTVRFEFPASGYLNPTKSFLSFNCRSKPTGTFTAGTQFLNPSVFTNNLNVASGVPNQQAFGGFEFQQNIASIFRRVKVTYGSLVLEDIQDFNILQRMFTDLLLPSGASICDNMMYQGIGRANRNHVGWPNDTNTNDRYNYHSLEVSPSAAASPGTVTNVGTVVRRYAIPINTGVFQQKRLIPLKFMSSQLAIEFELAEAADCQIWTLGSAGVSGTPAVPTASQTEIGLVELNAELLEFDAEFDRAVFTGLSRGLAIPFQSWHVTAQSINATTQATMNIQESARSVRYALAALTDDRFRTIYTDAHYFAPGLLCTQSNALVAVQPLNFPSQMNTQNDTLLDSYQWRLGGVYYPSQPVPAYGGSIPNGDPNQTIDSNYADPPVECHAEVMKVFDNQFARSGVYNGETFLGFYGDKRNGAVASNNIFANNFIIGVDFLTDRGDVVGGINAEEQNDMQLTLRFQSGAAAGQAKVVRIAVCFDNIMILGESNNMVLIN